MSLDRNRIGAIFLSFALLGIIISVLALAQMDQNTIDLNETTGPTIKIGAIYNLMGPQSPLDLPSARGARLAVQEINNIGGIDGKDIELILCDARSNTSTVSECAKDLLAKNVSAMVGLSDTDMVLAAVPITSEAGIPFVTSGATSPDLAKKNGDLFLACFGDNVQAEAGAEYAFNEMNLKRCILLVDGDMEYARILAGYFRQRYQDLGGEIVMEAFLNGTDKESLSRDIADADSDMIYLAAGPDKAKATIDSMRRSGIDSPVYGGDSLDSSDLKKDGMGMIVFSTHSLLDENSSITGEFFRAYRDEYGCPPENAFSALGYDTIKLLAEAIDRAGSDDPEAILEFLGNTSGFRGATGEISYLNGGRIPSKDVPIVSLVDGVVTSSAIVKATI